MKRLLYCCLFVFLTVLESIWSMPQAAAADKKARPVWQEEWDKTVAAAKQEGKLVIYTTGGPEFRRLISQNMQEKIGIPVEFVSGKGAELAEKILSERRAGLYLADVYVGGGKTLITALKPAGALAPIKPLLLLPEVLDSKSYFEDRLPYLDKEKMYVLVYGPTVANTLCINTDLVKPGEIKASGDLLNPKWKEKIVLYDPTIAGTANNWFFVMANKVGLDYHRQLVKQKPMITRDKRLQVEWVAKGKYSIALAPSKDVFAQFLKLGAPIAWVPTADLMYLSDMGTLALYDKAPHPQASKVFINWLMSKEGLSKWSKTTLLSTARRDVPQDFLGPESRRDANMQYFDLNTEELTLEISKYSKFAREIYGPLVK